MKSKPGEGAGTIGEGKGENAGKNEETGKRDEAGNGKGEETGKDEIGNGKGEEPGKSDGTGNGKSEETNKGDGSGTDENGKGDESGNKSGKYTEDEIQSILENIKGDGFKNNPLRQAYENEVVALKSYGEELLASGMSEEQVARTLNQARRDLGVKYKDMTPQPLRDYIYEINRNRYDGDELGPTYDYLKKAGKSDSDIIDSASRPNTDIDKLLIGFEEWLRGQ